MEQTMCRTAPPRLPAWLAGAHQALTRAALVLLDLPVRRDARPVWQLACRTILRNQRSHPPVSSRVLERCMRALGVHPDSMSSDPDEQAAWWRSLAADRPLLIVADNAARVGQVRPLIPGSAPAAILITSRDPLDGLTDNGAHLRNRPETTVASLAASLQKHSLATEPEVDDDPTAAYDRMYHDLPAPVRECYRFLGSLPGPDFTLATIAALTGRDHDQAAGELTTLVDARLVEAPSSARYVMHDTARRHARTVARAAETEAIRQARRDHIITWYRDTAADAMRAINGRRWFLGACFHRPIGIHFTRDEALAWQDAEKANLLSIQQMAYGAGDYDAVMDITEALWGLFTHLKPHAEWLAACEAGLKASVFTGNKRAEARMLEGFGAAHCFRQEFAIAERYYVDALALEKQADHQQGMATALEGLGVSQLGAGDYGLARKSFYKSLDMSLRLGNTRDASIQWRHIGETELADRKYDRADKALEKAKELLDPGEHYLECRRRLTHGHAYLGAGDAARARRTFKATLDLARTIGAAQEIPNALVGLANEAKSRGSRREELLHLQDALGFYAELGAPQADHVKNRIDALENDIDEIP